MSYQKPLRTFLTKSSVILFLTMNLGIADDNQNQEETERAAKNHVANIIYAPIAQGAEKHLSAMGLAKSEIDDAVDEISNEFANCIVSSLRKANNEETQYAIELIAAGAPDEEISAYFDSLQVDGSADPLEVFENEADYCLESIDASYGLSE